MKSRSFLGSSSIGTEEFLAIAACSCFLLRNSASSSSSARPCSSACGTTTLLLGLGLVPWPAVTFLFSLGSEDDGCAQAEALDAVIVIVGKPSVHWQDASTTGVEALAAAIDELEAGGGTEDFEILGDVAFEAAG